MLLVSKDNTLRIWAKTEMRRRRCNFKFGGGKGGKGEEEGVVRTYKLVETGRHYGLIRSFAGILCDYL